MINNVVTLLLLLGQIVAPIVASAESRAQASVQTANEIYFSENQQPITSLQLNAAESKTILLTDENAADSEATVILPTGVSINEAATKEANANAAEIKYEQEQSKVNVQWNNQQTGTKKASLVLVGTSATQGEIYAQVTRNQQLYQSAKVATTVVAATTDSSNEVANKTVETTANVQQKGPILRSGDTNVDIDIAPQTESISSGQNAAFVLNFKVTGSQTTYQNAKIVVELPENASFNQNLSELAIAGVLPTYDSDTNQLTYVLNELEAGKAYKTILKVVTKNGVTKNATEVNAAATFTADNFAGNATDDAQVIVNAASSLSTSKEYTKTLTSDGSDKSGPPTSGDTGIWTIQVNADKTATGLLYFKEGSKIKVVDSLPADMKYVSDNAGGSYDVTSHTVSWEFDAPTLAAQENATTTLFTKTIEVTVQFPTTIDGVKGFLNTSETTAVDYGDNEITSKKEALIYAGPSGGEIISPEGIYFVSTHYGPKDGSGSIQYGDYNPNPSVYGDGKLKFEVLSTPFTTNSPSKDYKKYEVIYSIDDHLNLTDLHLGYGVFQPDVRYTVGKPLSQEEQPQLEIYGTIDGSERLLTTTTPDAENGVSFSEKDLGIAEGTHVSQLRMIYTYRKAGSMHSFDMNFDIQKGYTGVVKNQVNINAEGYNSAGDEVSWNNDTAAIDPTSISGSRTATVVPTPPEAMPIISNTISFDQHDGSEVQLGSNRVAGYLKNEGSSVKKINRQLEMDILLPTGVTVDTANPEYQLGDGFLWGEKTDTGLNKENGSIEIISANYQGTGKQLVRVKWSAASISAGTQIGYAFNVTIANNAPTKLIPEAYAFIGNEDFSVPSTSENQLTGSTKEADADDINGDGNTDQQRAKTGNQYYLSRQDQITTKKLVKGDLDTDYSKMGHATPGGQIQYQLQVTNNGVSPISNFVLFDVLPSVGDLGITDNLARESKFVPTLVGPILSPSAWGNKVTITYSTAANPSRADLVANVDYPDTTDKLEDPAGAQAPNWLAASAVTDWSQIRSFKVTLNSDVEFVSGENIVLDFVMNAPTDLSKELTDSSKEENTRAAWNSFAYATNNLQAVEPERVGVVVNAEEPVITKDVEGKQNLDLTNRNDAFNWNVKASFGNTTANWTQASITDKINDLLEIKSVKVVDENGVDVTENGSVTTDGNNITFTLNQKEGSYTYLTGHTYTMTINTVIGQTVTAEQLAPYIKDGGIPNQADLHFGADGESIHSEIPTVIPPEEEPVITKDVEGKQNLDLNNRNDAFNWNIHASFGNTTATWKQAAITDKINALLEIKSVKVVDEKGTDVTANGNVTIENNQLTFTINQKEGSYTYLAGHTYTMTVQTTIKTAATEADLAPYVKDGGIPNQADLHFGADGEIIHSEIPTVTPPEEKPVITKDIEGKQHLDLTNRDDTFNWHVNVAFGNTTAGWKQAAITDKINDLLEIKAVKVVDEKGTDVTANGTVTIKNNQVTFTLNKQNDSYTYLAGKTYTMTIQTKIKASTTQAELAPYIIDGGIPNQADLHFGANGEIIHSEKPAVTPPSENQTTPPKEKPSKNQLPRTGEQTGTYEIILLGLLVIIMSATGYLYFNRKTKFEK